MGFQLIAPLTATGLSFGGSALIKKYIPRDTANLPTIQRLAAIGALAVTTEVVQSVVERMVADRFETNEVADTFDGDIIDGEVIDHED